MEQLRITLYSLPQEFSQAIFDFKTFMCMDKGLGSDNHIIIFTVPSESYDRVKVDQYIQDMMNYMNCVSGEIFEMSVLESPFFYASKLNNPSDYKSLRIIKKIEF
ncbi:hypothetical protein SAMN04487969_110101 [Paenibacillus algorifonticola]|uniref:Uncharacterized protein n=1 Tax=Paenibacillus algorifonticola TaxID=684063 RepID=A0A1I2EYA3_9BACL|nr:hypothetical protein SAMN04487969_110101 [Paenibacillus algorifonticola]